MDAASPRHRWWGLVALTLGVSMIIVDATVVNVAIPTIIRDLDMSAPDAEWMNTIYSLVFAALLVSLGRAGDLYGRRRLFLAGVAVFVLASLWAGRAGSPGALIGARFVQGIGGAMILPSTLSSVNAMFRGKERAIAFGVWGSVIGGMAALGPLVGGWLTTDHSWRWIFYINLPVGLIAAAGALRLVPETRDEHAARGMDPAGVLTSALGLGALVFALIESQRHGWWEPTRTFSALGFDWPLDSVSIVPVAPKLRGACPIPAASGLTSRHRLSRAGHRAANAALYRTAIVRMRLHQPTIEYVARRTAEGLSKKDIIRCLKRFLAREIYQRGMADHRARQAAISAA